MKKLVLRIPDEREIPKVGKQLTAAYQSSYAGLMDETYLASLPEDHWNPILRESMCRGDTCIIAEQDGCALATAVFGTTDESRDSVVLHAIYVSSHWVGKGIGHLLYTELEQRMVAQGARRCLLEVLSANNRAIRFYLSHGFQKTGTFNVEENGMTFTCDTMCKFFI